MNKCESALSNLLPYWKFHSDYLFHEDGALTSGLELRGVSLESRSDDAISLLRNQAILFLHSLPLNAEFQFLYQVRPFSPIMTRFKDETERDTPEKYRFIWRESANYLEGHSNIWNTKLFLFLTLPQANRAAKRTIGSSIKRALLGISPKCVIQESSLWFNKRREEMYHAMEKLKSSVAMMDIKCRELARSDLGSIIYSTLNPTRAAQLSFSEQFLNNQLDEGVSDELALSSLQRFPREFILDDEIHRIMSLRDLPQSQYLGAIAPLISLREFPFDIIVGLEHEDSDKVLKVLRRARNFNANLKNSGKTDELAVHEHAVLQETIDRLVQGEEQSFGLTFQIHYWGRNEEELRYAEAVLRNSVHQCSEAKEIREEFSYPWSFVGSLPGGFKKLKGRRDLHTITPQTLSLLPIYQQNLGATRPVAMFKTRTDELVSLDPFNHALAAYNAIIFGPTGRGKSFLAQYLLLHYFRLAPKIIIVDIGGSYRRITKLLGGEYLALRNDSEVALNPFPKKTPDPTTLGELSGIIERMVKDEGSKPLDRLRQHNIRRAILAMYEEGSEINFVGFKQSLERLAISTPDQEDKKLCNDLAKRLSLWIEGEGRALLVSRKTISLDNPIITIDLAGIPPSGDLQAVVMQILARLIRQKVSTEDGPKIILFDEVWKHLADPTAAGILDELYRTARKRFTSVISISQELEDFLNPMVKTSIVKNSETKFILQTLEELPLLEKAFRLNSNELNLIRGLTMQRGLYSEVFCMVGDEHQVLRVESTPWLYWMCTTHPPELEFEREVESQFPEMGDLERVRWLAAKFPKGLSSLDLDAARKKLAKGEI